jgi:hypothetical protein
MGLGDLHFMRDYADEWVFEDLYFIRDYADEWVFENL